MLAIGAWLRFKLDTLPASTADTWGFLKPALLALNGEDFEAVYGRPWMYPSFLYLTIKITGGFRTISVLQHLAGLLAGLFLLVSAPLALRAVKKRATAFALQACVLYAALMFLTSNWRVTFEHMLIAEAVQPLFAASVVLCMTGIASAFAAGEDKSMRLWGQALLFSAGTGTLYQSRFAAVGALCLVIGIMAVRRASPTRKACLKALAPVFLAIATLWCCGNYFSRHDFLKDSTPGDVLFSAHAPVIVEELRREAAAEAGDKADFLNTLAAQLEIDMRKKPLYSSLGYFPYMVQWHGGSRAVAEYFSYDGKAAGRFESMLFLRAAQRHPGWYTGKVCNQLYHLYGWTPAMILDSENAALPGHKPPIAFGMGMGRNERRPLQGGWYKSLVYLMTPEFRNSGFGWWQEEWRQAASLLLQPGPLNTYIQDLKTTIETRDPDSQAALAGGFAGGIFDHFLFLNMAWYVPVLGLFLLACGALTLRSKWDADLALLAALAGFAHLFIFATAALCAMTFVLEDMRYFQDLDIFLCVGQYCGLAFSALTVLRLLEHGKKPDKGLA